MFEEVLNLINSQEIGNIDDGLQPVIILVDPQLGENIGASARGMWNFGLKNLRLVNPRDGWPNPKAGSVAAGGGIVLDNVKVYSDLQNAVKDLDYVFATSIRYRDLDKNVSSWGVPFYTHDGTPWDDYQFHIEDYSYGERTFWLSPKDNASKYTPIYRVTYMVPDDINNSGLNCVMIVGGHLHSLTQE